jgi:signal transduction histidine kinase
MGRGWWSRASVRLRTTLAATVVVAVALLFGAVCLVAWFRASLRDGIESTAEERATSLAAEIEDTGLPHDGVVEGDDAEDVADVVWQVLWADGTVARQSQPLTSNLPGRDVDELRLAGSDHPYVVDAEEAEVGPEEYDVVVAVSLESVDEPTATLVKTLLVGVPLLLVLVAGTTWVVATRALAPVDRIRREVDQITGDQLDRRVPEPGSRDEIHRLARTMNQMLGRLEQSTARQQQFVGDASHELRSPLASIRQAAEVARAHPGALPEGELADAVLEESARVQRLVEQLLILTRTGDGAVVRTPQDVDLDDLALAEGRRVFRAGLRVDTTEVAAGRVRGDPTALAQVVRNLVDNAARHARAQVRLVVQETETGVELVVEDDGPGIAEGDRARVFERFVRLDEARTRDEGGSGLGLSIVKEIVVAHDGDVVVASSPSGGARFVVCLPVSAASRASAARAT